MLVDPKVVFFVQERGSLGRFKREVKLVLDLNGPILQAASGLLNARFPIGGLGLEFGQQVAVGTGEQLLEVLKYWGRVFQPAGFGQAKPRPRLAIRTAWDM